MIAGMLFMGHIGERKPASAEPAFNRNATACEVTDVAIY
jgi:hypothetical protein